MKRITTLAALVLVGAGISVAGSGKSRDPIFHASLEFRDALQIEPLLRHMQTEEQIGGCTVIRSSPGASIEETGESPTVDSEPRFNEQLSVAEEAEWFDRSVNARGAGGRLPPTVRF
jgi:hypothetical protein